MVSFENVMEQVVWFNSQILIANKPIFNGQMFHAGIIRVSDIVHSDFSFLSIIEFTNKFPGINFMEYVSVVQAFPVEWRRWFRNKNGPDFGIDSFQPRVLLIDAQKSIVNISYRTFHRNMYLLETKRLKWQMILDTPLWIQDIMKVVKKLRIITNDAKLRSYQFKLLMHAVVTNIQLQKWKIIQSDRCTFCNEYAKSLKHLFWECDKVKIIWA